MYSLTKVLVVVLISAANSTLRPDECSKDVTMPRCCCLTFEYTVENQHVGEHFRNTLTLLVDSRKAFIHHMEDAVMQNTDGFKSFTTNFTSPYGHMVKSINSVTADQSNKAFWSFTNKRKMLTVGVSTYYPKPCDEIALTYTPY